MGAIKSDGCFKAGLWLVAAALSLSFGTALARDASRISPQALTPLELSFPLATSTADEAVTAAREASLAALADLENHDVQLIDADLRMSSERPVSVVTVSGQRRELTSCDYGPVEDLVEVDLPTEDNHLLATVRVGTPEAHAANAVYCEYAADALASDDAPVSLRVRGCFLMLAFSIPTASHLVLHPAPASACGLYP